MENVVIIDSIMGAGKTSWAIQEMNEAPEEKRFIYITPFNSEVDRIKESVTKRVFYSTNNGDYDGKKMNVFKQWVSDGADIVSTHALFQNADEELIGLLTDAGYTLILDEVMDVIDVAPIKPDDIRMLIDAEAVKIESGKRVVWVTGNYADGRFNDIRRLAEAGSLYYHRGKFLIYTFPPHIFKLFDAVYILTYLFRGQIQRYYFDLHRIPYVFKAVRYTDQRRYELTEYRPDTEDRAALYKLIDVYSGALNNVAPRNNTLSSSWLIKARPESFKAIRDATRSFLMNYCGAKASDALWTTKKDYADKSNKLKVKDYASAFLHLNCRATNEYADRWALAYVYNRYPIQTERVFFEDHGISIDQDALAVSDLLQWVWRSRIRKGQPIKLFLPSPRMRSLLERWAQHDI